MRPFTRPAAFVIGLVAAALALGFGAPRDAAAATREFYFARLGSERGLAQNSVNALVQDAQGFVWVGTQGGLHRYDGQRFIAYRHDPRNPASLPESFITSLATDGRNALWVGTYSQSVARLDLSTGAVRRYPLSAGKDHASRQVMALMPHAGRIWIGTMSGLQQLDAATGTLRRVLDLDPRTLRDASSQQLLADRDGVVWYASGAGLYRIDPQGHATLVGAPQITLSLLLDHRGQLWAGRNDGLYRVLPDRRSLLKVWPAQDADPSAGQVRTIVEAPDHRLWLSIPGQGLRLYDPASGDSKRIQEDPSLPASLPDNVVNALLVDRSGMLWVGGQFRGIALTDPSGSRFIYVLNTDGGPGRNAAGDSIRAIQPSPDGAIWLGTDNARLQRYDPDTDRFDDLSAALPAGNNPARVTAIADAGHGRLWLATTNGLAQLDSATRTIEAVDLGAFSRTSLRSVLVDHRGDLWLGTDRIGALLYQRAGNRVIHYGQADGDPRRLSHPSVHAILEDRQERIWFGTGDGLDMLEPASGRLHHFRHISDRPDSLPGNLVRALHQGSDGTIWVGTHAGLGRVVEPAGGAITFASPLVDALDASAVPVVFSIAQARSGELWLGTDSGMLRFNPRTGDTHRYGLADGLQDLEFNGGAVASLSGGRLAFGGVHGLNVFSPERITESRFVPAVRLLSARIGAADTDAGTWWQATQLDVPASAQIVRLRVGALDFAPAADLRYRYKLDGFDKDWIDNGHQQDVTYTQLPPGRYTLRVQSTNRDGHWVDNQLVIPLQVATPLWRHPLVLAAAALALVGLLVSAVARWRRRRQREREHFEQLREREERLNLALWASGEQYWDYDLDRRILHRMQIDDSGQNPTSELQTQPEYHHEIHGDDLATVLDLLRQHLRGQTALFLSEHRVQVSDGPWRWVRARGRVVERGSDGRALRVAGTARDITASRGAESERRIATEVLRSMAEAVAVFDLGFMFVSVNPAFTRITGYEAIEAIGHPTNVLDSRQHDPDFYLRMRAELERNGTWSGEIWQQRKDDSEFLCWLQASSVQDAAGQGSHYVAVLSDITDQKRAEQELRYLANYDTLTSLPNRALLSERLARAIVRARRNGTRIAVLFLDLDRFKDINDSLGHAAGDRILRAAATRLQQLVGPDDTVARLGGDEFTVVLENLQEPEQADQVARDIIAAFEMPLDFDERHDVSISPSIGISLYPDHAHVPTDLLKHADAAMYQAKAAGRRTYARYSEAMDVDIRGRATISAALRNVLDRNELRLVFQPRLSLPEQRITGVEALLRWTSAEYGEIPPSQFIPLAEETGLILEIGEWVLREACKVMSSWRRQGLVNLTMAVNVSALQLLRGNLPQAVVRALEESGIPAQCLELELTESVIMANAEQTTSTLQSFRELGVGLAIDDFGTGYSSLAYLKRLPITTLKIDKEFVEDLTRDPDDEAITSTVIAMAHALGLTVVAEGVETLGQMQFLLYHACDEIQGYWLARPMDAEQCLGFIRTWAPQREPLEHPASSLR